MIKVYQGNTIDALRAMRRDSVDCVVTSPPYWKVRKYLPDGHPLEHLELGQEPTPVEFVESLRAVFREVYRVLSPFGTAWVNIGDTYSHSGCGGGGSFMLQRGKRTWAHAIGKKGGWAVEGLKRGNRCLIPERLSIALQEDGWIVRDVVVWSKPQAMPSSPRVWEWRPCQVKVGKSARGTERYKQGATQGKPHGSRSLDGRSFESKAKWKACPGCPKCEKNEGMVLGKGAWRCTSSWEPILMLAKERHYFSKRLVTKGLSAEYEWANQRNVWSIASEPQKEKHYASFPVELPARCISAGVSTDGYCSACGSPIIPSRSGPRPTCKCGQAARTGVVLDPFVGSGRSLIAAARLGANAIGVELNADYVQMARRTIEREMPMWPVSIEEVPVGQAHGGAA